MAEKNPQFNLLGLALRLGYQIAIPLLICLAIGIGLDLWLGTKPIITLTLLPFSIGISVYIVYREMLPYLKVENLKKPDKQVK